MELAESYYSGIMMQHRPTQTSRNTYRSSRTRVCGPAPAPGANGETHALSGCVSIVLSHMQVTLEQQGERIVKSSTPELLAPGSLVAIAVCACSPPRSCTRTTAVSTDEDDSRRRARGSSTHAMQAAPEESHTLHRCLPPGDACSNAASIQSALCISSGSCPRGT